MIPTNRRQAGFIKFGGGLNKRVWMARAKAEGYFVLDCGSHAELYLRGKADA